MMGLLTVYETGKGKNDVFTMKTLYIAVYNSWLV